MEVQQCSSKGLRGILTFQLGSGRDRGALVYAILLAQVLSVALATTGVSSQALTNQGVYAPTTQAFFNYCLLAVVFGIGSILVPLIQHRRQVKACSAGSSGADGADGASLEAAAAKWHHLRRCWPSFAALALVDVEANVLVTKAYQYTSLTSVTLLDCFTIPCVMLLSWLLLQARYKTGHYVGSICCIAGLAVLVLGDSQGASANSTGSVGAWSLQALFGGDSAAHTGAVDSNSGSSSSSSGSFPLLGDSLVLLGAVLYAVCNVTQELLLADIEPGQLLALLGVFGGLISGAQALLLEHKMLLSVQWGSSSVLLPMAGFAAAMFLFYSLVPQVLMLGGATVLNLGLLTSDGWAALARYLWFGGFGGWSAYFFVGSLLLVAGGLVVFTLSGSPKGSQVGQQGPQADVGAAVNSRGVAGALDRTDEQTVSYSRLQTAGDVEDQQGLCSAPQVQH